MRISAIVKSLIIIVVLFIGFSLYANIKVDRSAPDRIFSNFADIPHHKVGLLLGTNPYKWGEPNSLFIHRVDVAGSLYNEGKIDTLLISGVFDGEWYDEPRAMRDSLIKRGVPASRIKLDYGGLRTIDSIIRAKKIFGCDSVTIISQPDHCARALYLADSEGLESVGAAAPSYAPFFVKIYSWVREILARDKMMLELLIR